MFTCTTCPLTLPCLQDQCLELQDCAFCNAQVVTVRDAPAWWFELDPQDWQHYPRVPEQFDCPDDRGVRRFSNPGNRPIKLICTNCRVRLGYGPSTHDMVVL